MSVHHLNSPDSPISITQNGPDDFTVQYGKQVDGPGLNYKDAAAQLGQAYMHALGCTGFYDEFPTLDDSDEFGEQAEAHDTANETGRVA